MRASLCIFLITLLITCLGRDITFFPDRPGPPPSTLTTQRRPAAICGPQTDLLVERLSVTALEDCGPILDRVHHASKSSVMLVDANGHIVQDTNSQLLHPVGLRTRHDSDCHLRLHVHRIGDPSPCGTGTRPQPSSRRMARPASP